MPKLNAPAEIHWRRSNMNKRDPILMISVEVRKDCRSLNAADEMNCPMPRSVEKVPVRDEKRCTAAHRRRGIIDVVISLRRSDRPHRLNVALAAYGQVALDDLYQRWRVFTDRAVAITQTATVRLTKQVTVDLVLVEIPERALVRQSISGISYTFITSGAVRQAVGTNGSTNCSGSRGQPASTFRSRRIRRSRSGPPPSVRTAVSCFSRPLWSTSKGDISE